MTQSMKLQASKSDFAGKLILAFKMQYRHQKLPGVSISNVLEA